MMRTPLSTDAASPARVEIEKSSDIWRVTCLGNWSMTGVHDVDDELRDLANENYPALEVNTSGADVFDTAGAWLVERLRLSSEQKNRAFEHLDFDKRRTDLVDVIDHEHDPEADVRSLRHRFAINPLETFGRGVVDMWQDFLMGCYLIGSAVRGTQMKGNKRGGMRMTSIIHHVDNMGLKAVPVIAVMSFLIGGIIAQQGAYQLRFYGEELLTVNLVGILHFREISVLLTAIMVAGRTGSAITAEIGTMKMREEIDALQVIGLNPVGVLIMPRLLALIIVLPILTLLSDIAGIAGAIVVTDLYVGIRPVEFVNALLVGVPPQHLIAGLIKAPFMAVIIGLAAAIEGLKVGGSSESLGKRTTAAVVRAIFAVIVVDGLFAIFLAAIDY